MIYFFNTADIRATIMDKLLSECANMTIVV
jgi:hypothetical protein